jgi:hypothetical protein
MGFEARGIVLVADDEQTRAPVHRLISRFTVARVNYWPLECRLAIGRFEVGHLGENQFRSKNGWR